MALRWRIMTVAIAICSLGIPIMTHRASAQPAAADPLSFRTYLPVVQSASPPVCPPIPEESYATIPVHGLSPDPGVPAELHPDLNLALRGSRENLTAHRGLVDINGAVDPGAPKLQTLFSDGLWHGMSHVYQVHQWDGRWPGVYGVYPITTPEVTLAGLVSTSGEKVHVPYRSAEIFHNTVTGKHYVAMVLYAAPDRITLKYTRDDHVITGYTIHIEGICVEPRLVALYNQSAAAGRTNLPGLEYGQAIGRASGAEVGVAIRDTGAFMDPRSRKDWWQGLTGAGLVDVPVLDVSDEAWYQERQERLAPQAREETAR